MWDATNLELVMEVRKAHEGQRIQCAAVAPDGFLYTGGDDKVCYSHKQQHRLHVSAACLFNLHFTLFSMAVMTVKGCSGGFLG